MMDIHSDQEKDKQLPPLEIPMEMISSEALEGIMEDFILREGTDYGWVEKSHEFKKEQILKQIQKNEIKITFDPNSETVSLMTKLQWNKCSE
jgi:uncharacterized protein